MGHPPRLSAPFFEIGPKNLMRLPQILAVAHAAARAGTEHDVSVILTVPDPLIPLVRAEVPEVFVFAQTMSAQRPGPSVGCTIAESLADAGAHGVMLNHDSCPLDAETLAQAVRRASELGLMTMACAGSDSQAIDLARLGPTVVLYEPPDLIGKEGGGERPWIRAIDERIRGIDADVLMMHAGGVADPGDAYSIMSNGARGTGVTSGVVRADDPTDAAARFIEQTRRGFDRAHDTLIA